MSKNNVISAILRQIPGEGRLEVMDKTPVRDFIWVEDAAEGVVALALSNYIVNNQSALFNLGTGIGTSIGSLAELALDVAEQPERLVYANNVSDRQSSLILDFSDTTSACGWQPKTSLRQGLTKILQKY
jgi:nucleoside-diphosphate-sugar epimerase